MSFANAKLFGLLSFRYSSWHEFSTECGDLEATIKILAWIIMNNVTFERVINNLQKKALTLGFELIPQPSENLVS